MTRIAKTAHEIHDEVARLVHEIPAIVEDGEAVEVGFPVHLIDAPGEGPNWTIDHVGNGHAYLPSIREVIAKAQSQWDLTP